MDYVGGWWFGPRWIGRTIGRWMISIWLPKNALAEFREEIWAGRWTKESADRVLDMVTYRGCRLCLDGRRYTPLSWEDHMETHYQEVWM